LIRKRHLTKIRYLMTWKKPLRYVATENLINLIKYTCQNPPVILYLMIRHWTWISLRSGIGQGQFAHIVLFDIILKVLAYTIKQNQEIKRIQIGKREMQLGSQVTHLSLWKNLKNQKDKLNELINKSCKEVGYTVTTTVFLYISMDNWNLKKKK
jgi:hypothetical protein